MVDLFWLAIEPLIFRRPGYEGLIVGMRDWFGTAEEAFLYHTGYDAGIRYGKSHQEFAAKLGIKDPIQILSTISMPLYVSMGLGKPEVVEVKAKPPQALIRIYNVSSVGWLLEPKNPTAILSAEYLLVY